MKTIEFYKFVSWEVSEPSHQTMKDYKRISTSRGYDIATGTYKLLGYIYLYYKHLKKFWYKNHGVINEAYALNITDLKRLIRAHYITIGKDFKAVEINKGENKNEDM